MRVADILASGEIGAALTEKRLASPSTKAEKEEKADAEGFLKQLRLGKSYVRGTDRAGRPVVWIKVKLHRGGDQTVKSLEQFGVWHIESTRLMFGEGVSSAVCAPSFLLFYPTDPVRSSLASTRGATNTHDKQR